MDTREVIFIAFVAALILVWLIDRWWSRRAKPVADTTIDKKVADWYDTLSKEPPAQQEPPRPAPASPKKTAPVMNPEDLPDIDVPEELPEEVPRVPAEPDDAEIIAEHLEKELAEDEKLIKKAFKKPKKPKKRKQA